MSVSFLTMVVLEKGIGSDGDSPILTNIFIGSNILWVGAVVADMFEYGTSSPPTPPIGMFSTRDTACLFPAEPVLGVCSVQHLPRQGVPQIKGCEHQRYDR